MFESETPHNLGSRSRHDKSPLSYIRYPARLPISVVRKITARGAGSDAVALVVSHHDSSAVGPYIDGSGTSFSRR